jgi:uncharacterized protein YcaQ
MAEIIPVEKVQKFILEKQGLRTERSVNSTLDLIKKIHNVQIDTISVVARSQDLTVYNRFPEYKEKDIWKLEQDKKLFEFYSHRLCLMPIEEFPFYLWIFDHFRKNLGTWTKNWASKNTKIIDHVYTFIKKHGETASSDFKSKNKAERGGWGEIKSENLALKYLFHTGKLLISFRKGFQRYYDLTERILPANISSEPMEKNELSIHMLNSILKGLGVVSLNEILNYLGKDFPKIIWDGKKQSMIDFLEDSVKDGLLMRINIQSLKDPFYTLESEYDELISQIIEPNPEFPVKLLTPFDNIIRDRYYPKTIWNFDYKFEAYVPKAKRQFGFFCLPILDNYDLVGFIDVKAHRKDKRLELISGYLNKEIDHNFTNRLERGIHDFAQFHGCIDVSIGKFHPNEIKVNLSKELNKK